MGQENIQQTVDKMLDDIAAKRETAMGKSAEQVQNKYKSKEAEL